MSEMIDRIAQALSKPIMVEFDGCHPDQHDWDNMPGRDKDKEKLRALARTTLLTLREPTEAMTDAAFASSTSWGPAQVWQDMIDAALNEGPRS